MAADVPEYVEPVYPLQGVAGEIAEVIGRTQTIRLVAAFEDRTSRSWRVCFYVPKRIKSTDHQLCRILGYRDARRLCRAFGGEILQTSNLQYLERHWREHSIHKCAHVLGFRSDEIAAEMGVSLSLVRKTLATNPPEVTAVYLREHSREPSFDL